MCNTHCVCNFPVAVAAAVEVRSHNRKTINTIVLPSFLDSIQTLLSSKWNESSKHVIHLSSYFYILSS